MSARRLMQLYGVDPQECWVLTPDNWRNAPVGLITLMPRRDGKYQLPEEES